MAHKNKNLILIIMVVLGFVLFSKGLDTGGFNVVPFTEGQSGISVCNSLSSCNALPQFTNCNWVSGGGQTWVSCPCDVSLGYADSADGTECILGSTDSQCIGKDDGDVVSRRCIGDVAFESVCSLESDGRLTYFPDGQGTDCADFGQTCSNGECLGTFTDFRCTGKTTNEAFNIQCSGDIVKFDLCDKQSDGDIVFKGFIEGTDCSVNNQICKTGVGCVVKTIGDDGNGDEIPIQCESKPTNEAFNFQCSGTKLVADICEQKITIDPILKIEFKGDISYRPIVEVVDCSINGGECVEEPTFGNEAGCTVQKCLLPNGAACFLPIDVPIRTDSVASDECASGICVDVVGEGGICGNKAKIGDIKIEPHPTCVALGTTKPSFDIESILEFFTKETAGLANWLWIIIGIIGLQILPLIIPRRRRD